MLENQKASAAVFDAPNANTSFINVSSGDDQIYINWLLANYCMPTLFRLKPSCLIRVNKQRINCRTEFLESMREETGAFGVSCFLIFENDAMYNFLVYQKDLLKLLFMCPETMEFFQSCGYDCKDGIRGILKTLKSRFEQYYQFRANQDRQKYCKSAETKFPHEIGIILGYPLEDVLDFIKYNGREYVLCGCWKVYHNPEETIKTFELYWNLRQYAIKKLKQGAKIRNISLYELQNIHKIL